MKAKLFAAVVVALLVLPAIASAGIPRPRAGFWKIGAGEGFKVTSNRKAITTFHVDGTSCGYKKISLEGSQTMHYSTSAGISNWLVGRNDPGRRNPHDISGVIPQVVKFKSGGKTIHARLSIVFGVGGYTRDNDWTMVIKGCEVFGNATHA